MPTPPPRVEVEQQHPTLAVADVAAAAEFYATRLGFTVAFVAGEPPNFAGVNIGGVQLFLERGTPAPDGGAVFYVVDDAEALYAFHRAGGVEVLQEIGDRDYGFRDYTVRDRDRNRLTFGHRLNFPAEPPLEIERVDVPVRLEKRLAALLQDLALHKRMSLTSTLEEILLHTNEPLGDGVASPHTQRTLMHIQQLKKKHGIDYDSHASYRFVERQGMRD